mmetsp:Transcript_21503/g.46745  ORF Transcript_21503/g.46745 Transcript_21503/m.46745 type:complete len:85 (+) Transcript_21503:229-483(+)
MYTNKLAGPMIFFLETLVQRGGGREQRWSRGQRPPSVMLDFLQLPLYILAAGSIRCEMTGLICEENLLRLQSQSRLGCLMQVIL